MKKMSFFLAAVMLLSMLLNACGTSGDDPQASVSTWEASNIMQTTDPSQDDTLNVLMIGNSFCYYFTDELYAMAQAAGVKMRVCNVYYSGCLLDQHWTWWKNGEANYSFHENGKKLVENVDLNYCLKQGNWDVISLQSARLSSNSAEDSLENSKIYLEELLSYIRQQFPKSRMAWQQTWSYAVGTAGNGKVTPDAEAQRASSEKNRNFALLVCEKYDLLRINTGEAWQIIRDSGYDSLCARLGKKVDGAAEHTGDNYHDGDIGGGQYLNACVWFEILTGKSCVGNPYIPQYTYQNAPFEMLIDLETLQNAAHQAVANRNS